MHLTNEVHCLLSQYNLIHWPTDEDWFLCSSRQTQTQFHFYNLFPNSHRTEMFCFSALKQCLSTHTIVQGHFHPFAIPKMSQKMELTIHHQFGWITVFLAHHVGAHAHIHACITLSGVRNQQFTTMYLNAKICDTSSVKALEKLG